MKREIKQLWRRSILIGLKCNSKLRKYTKFQTALEIAILLWGLTSKPVAFSLRQRNKYTPKEVKF